MSTPLPPSVAPRRRRSRAQAGFTIVEVSLAAGVLALAIATSIITLQSGFRTIDVARGTTLASQILQSEMERLRMKSWTDMAALPASESFDGATYFSTNPDVAGKYTITRRVAADGTRPTEVLYITISVTWKSYDGSSHTRSFQSMYAKNGLYDYYYTLANS
jgi:Tfp pilus assembly protein PilV